MCDKFRTCGKRHKAKWQTSRIKRNSKGRFIEGERTLTKIFLGVVFLLGISMIGVNTIWGWMKSLETVLVVESTRAQVTWQEQVLDLVEEAGLNSEYAEKIIYCESRWEKDAIHRNRGSVDRGIWQINSYFHPEVSESCAFSPLCATKEAIRIVKTKGWSEWVCSKYVNYDGI